MPAVSQVAHLSAGVMQAVLDGIPARVALLDRDRRHRFVNREYAAFIGKPVEAILGHTVAEVIGDEAFAQLRDHGARALAGETVNWEGWLDYRIGGQDAPRFVQRVYTPFRPNEQDAIPAGYFVFTRDLTQLQASEALSAAVIASALDCVVVIDEQGRVVAFNPAAERTFGYRAADVLGRPIAELIVPPAMRARHAAGFDRYLRTGQGTMIGRRVELEAMRADGEVFPAELTIAEMQLPGRRLFTAHLRDLTPVREAAAELDRHRRSLASAERMAALGTVLAGVAHELNNPLSIVIGNAAMLEEEVRESGVPGLLARAARLRHAADRCARVVQSFLATKRLRAPVRLPVDPEALAAELLGPNGPLRRKADLSLKQRTEPGLPYLQGDAELLRQALSQLLLNAGQAVALQPLPRCVMLDVHGMQGGVAFSIADNGPGIPEEARARLFQPFATTRPAGTGLGLGLATARGIIEAHGGSLSVQETPGGGATFIAWLPAGPAPPQPRNEVPPDIGSGCTTASKS